LDHLIPKTLLAKANSGYIFYAYLFRTTPPHFQPPLANFVASDCRSNPGMTHRQLIHPPIVSEY
jgi:hypothetical protein